eukprot:124375_1
MMVIEAAVEDCKNEMSFEWLLHRRDAADITVFTDASTSLGVGGFIQANGGPFFKKMWRDTFITRRKRKPDIVFEELMGVVLAATLYAHEWSGKSVLFRCDNWASCKILSKKCACFRRRDLNELVRVICKLAIKFRFHFWITHVPGIENDLADRLSRDKMIKHHELDHSLADEETDCTQMVEDLLRIFLKCDSFERARM